MAQIKDPADLKKLLLKLCPPNAEGRRSISILADAIGMSHYGVYKWINSGKITPGGATLLVEFARKRKVKLTYKDLESYVFGSPSS
jgi:hypothetical protein